MKFLFSRIAAGLSAAGLLAACSPGLDWREIRPEGSGLVVMLPCKPSTYARSVQLAGQPASLSLLACGAEDLTWALAHADLGDPTRVSAALSELQAAAVANLDATAPKRLPLAVPGATPNPASARVEITGRRPDGAPVQEQVAVFTHGTRVFQATVLGPRLPVDAVDTFFGGLRVAPP